MTPTTGATQSAPTTPTGASTTPPGATTQPGGTTQANPFDSITFTIVPFSGGGIGAIGGGGGGLTALGGDSALTATLFQAGSSSTPFQSISLKTSDQPAWSSFAPQTLTTSLTTPVTATSLGSVTIALIPGTESPNILAIQSIQVVLSSSSGMPAPVMLLNQSGLPLETLSPAHLSSTMPL